MYPCAALRCGLACMYCCHIVVHLLHTSFPKLIQQVQRNVTTINPSRQSEVSHGVNHTAMGSGIPLREPSGSVAG